MADQNEGSGTEQSVPAELRNVRYCEVIPVTRDGRTLTSWVYNTLGLNDCPAAEWDALTEDEVNEEYGSIAAKLNGPRYWVIDKLEASGSTTTGETFTFGGIEMALRAKLETKLREGTVGEQFYVPNEVQRDTVYTYMAGESVYELTSPEGDVYIMQSYAQIKDKNLTIDDLPSLGSRLSLPEGWTYSTRTLDEDYELVTDGLAYVINDDLYNSYQRRT
ncbi:MAG TPA: hypothetical protein VKB86_04410 [Pyrinomonadaceae bacterium]|nr:hypothetical protein [Pyrinomonadaceae bacterium]